MRILVRFEFTLFAQTHKTLENIELLENRKVVGALVTSCPCRRVGLTVLLFCCSGLIFNFFNGGINRFLVAEKLSRESWLL